MAGNSVRNAELTSMMRSNGYMTVTDVSNSVGVHRATIYRWIGEGKVEVKDYNGMYYLKWASIVDLLGDVAEVLGFTKQQMPDRKLI